MRSLARQKTATAYIVIAFNDNLLEELGSLDSVVPAHLFKDYKTHRKPKMDIFQQTCSFLVLLCCVTICTSQDAHMHEGKAHADQRMKPLKDKTKIHDQQHILDHLEGQINKPESEMTEQELQFHYFKVHDYDNNNKLDGIELVAAMTHYHEEDEGHEAEQMTEKDMAEMIDTILEEDDANKDGYIDFPEFVLSTN
ncbi:multiple coagulation factor deficiency protein 2 homolog [Ptychodera flava]|uniref:multiple coagulation factor deficiency protein 2 homolog n=1 Tax=Ptychodera flava TaxID=63121 RepID=UPI003969DBF3